MPTEAGHPGLSSEKLALSRVSHREVIRRAG
jgi:hypothetical protein